jgi:hypothetical protein
VSALRLHCSGAPSWRTGRTTARTAERGAGTRRPAPWRSA